MIRIIIIFSFLITISFSLLGSYIESRATYKMVSGDTNSFAKDHLRYWAYRKILTKELNRLGLRSEEFWKRYDAAFYEGFSGHEKRYEKAIELAKEDREKEVLKKQLREFRLRKRKNFSGLSQTVVSDSVKSFLVSQGVARIYLQAKINYRALKSLYGKFMMDVLKTKTFTSLTISSQFDWGMVPLDKVTLNTKDELERKVSQIWKNWFLENQDIQGKRFVYLEEENIEKIEVKKSASNGATLFISIRGVKQREGRDLRVRYEMSLALRDNDLNDFIFFRDLPSVMRTYSLGIDRKDEQLIVNDIGAIPITHFASVNSLLDRSVQAGERDYLTIRDFRNIRDIFNIQDQLKTLGISINLVTDLKFLGNGMAKILVKHNGSKESVMGIIKTLRQKFFPMEIVFSEKLASP